MRLWHYKLIHYLPKSQLLAQWRELNSIFKNQPKHILINYVYEYPKEDLLGYTYLVIEEMQKRKIKINSITNCISYFENKFLNEAIKAPCEPFRNHHNFRYLHQCFYNLQEKFDRGQADFSEAQYEAINDFMQREWENEIPF